MLTMAFLSEAPAALMELAEPWLSTELFVADVLSDDDGADIESAWFLVVIWVSEGVIDDMFGGRVVISKGVLHWQLVM